MGWEVEESAAALASAGGDVVRAAEALAAQEEEDLERYGCRWTYFTEMLPDAHCCVCFVLR